VFISVLYQEILVLNLFRKIEGIFAFPGFSILKQFIKTSLFVREHGVHAGPKDYFVVVDVVVVVVVVVICGSI
jgi:hypothetical protein